MGSIKIIMVDIEGCISETDKMMHMDLLNLHRIQRHQQSALSGNLPPLAINSGRSAGFIECMLRNIGFSPKGIWSVAENGSMILDFRSNKYAVDPSITDDIVKKMKRATVGSIPKLLKDIGGQSELGKEICISLNPPEGTAIERYFLMVREGLGDLAKITDVTHSSSAVDITPKGVNKGTGMRFAATRSGVELEEILYIGDSRGDFSALEIAGYAACPGNATPECKNLVKKLGGYISPFKTTKGVMDAVDHYNKK